MPEKENPKNIQNQAQDNAKPVDDLSQIPNPPVEDLTQEELDKLAGGAIGNFHLRLDGIKGESTDKDHKDW